MAGKRYGGNAERRAGDGIGAVDLGGSVVPTGFEVPSLIPLKTLEARRLTDFSGPCPDFLPLSFSGTEGVGDSSISLRLIEAVR